MSRRGRKRTKTEREGALAEVARLDRRGYSQSQIAAQLGVTQQMVSYDLRALRKRYATAAEQDTRAAIGEKLEQLREVRCEAWSAWERSKQDRARIVTDKTPVPQDDGTIVDRIKEIITREGRLPDNAYLQTILDTFRDECQLLGLIDTKGNVNVHNIIQTGIDWDKMREPGQVPDRIAERLEQERAKLLPPPTNGQTPH